jgi:hypothetical protein
MNTKINLFKDRELQVKLKNTDITQERILKQNKKCEELFDDWDFCIKKKGWNDETCVGQLRPRYEVCIQKRNLMQTLFDNKIDENQ